LAENQVTLSRSMSRASTYFPGCAGASIFTAAERVAPGAVEQVEMDVLPPASLGRYELQIDLVRENVAWFASKGTAKFWRMVEVE